MIKKIALILFALGTIGFVIFWMQTKHLPTQPTPNLNKPDSVMTYVVSTQFDAQGQIHATIKSPKITHYEKNDRSHFETPFIVLYPKNEPPWHITAKEGNALQGDKRIELIGNVVIRQLSGPNSHQIILKTSKMTFFPNRSFASTDQPVTITQPGNIVKSVGLTIDLNTGIIHLLSKAQGQYAISPN
ncbi:MAG: LPS export ABC transporter periplasmic protein LptC [Pseudomonadota bacterium]|nr:LPS export ABC transporter periplasmic protein LptC [Gammaproteobacteria bacterium]MBU1926512.1 LPS export ABC transporter periplasmic protein LptC [Gammaproteobacteria bacterium]MBU2545682.1 LPS export ABC transporter periplasmic protein LptC [Gammaproteobacteria bacterium]